MTGNQFDGRVAIVTGGASGIGEAAVKRFVAGGAKVVIADISVDAGEALAASLGADVAAFRKCDVASESEFQSLMDWTAETLGSIDIVFNNAGIGAIGDLVETPAEEWRRVIDIDLNSIFYSCRAAIPHMQRQGKGVIINNASISGMFGDFGMGAYTAAKGGVINLTRTLAMDYGPHNIRVNAVCPGATNTPLFAGVAVAPGLIDRWLENIPLRRLGKPEDIAEVVAFLSSDAASFMTGAIVPVDGGQTAATGTPDIGKYLALLDT